MIKNYIWDFDGTLFDSYPLLGEIFQKTLERHQISEPMEAIIEVMKQSMGEMNDFYADKYQLKDDFFAEFEEEYNHKERSGIRLYPYAKEICASIVRHGNRNFLFTHRGQTALDYLQDAGMDGYFTECVTRMNGFPRKPDPQGIMYLMQRYGLDPKETMIIGDRGIDLASGKAAGIHTCYYDVDQRPCSETADHVIHSLAELEVFQG